MLHRASVLLLLTACASPQEGVAGPSGDTDGSSSSSGAPVALTEPDTDWWSTLSGTTYIGTTSPITDTTGDPADDSTTAEGEEEEEEEDEDFIGVFLEGDTVPGETITGWGEFVVYVGGEDLCILGWEPQTVQPLDTCAECDFAFSVTVGEITVDVDEQCAAYNLDPVALEGSTLNVGHSGEETVLIEIDGTWTPIDEGWSEYIEDEMFWEWGAALQEVYP